MRRPGWNLKIFWVEKVVVLYFYWQKSQWPRFLIPKKSLCLPIFVEGKGVLDTMFYVYVLLDTMFYAQVLLDKMFYGQVLLTTLFYIHVVYGTMYCLQVVLDNIYSQVVLNTMFDAPLVLETMVCTQALLDTMFYACITKEIMKGLGNMYRIITESDISILNVISQG